MKKPSVPECLGGSQKIFLGCSTRLFSSFLRGASCPKSPRAPPLPATLFMRLTAKDVKVEKNRSVDQFPINALIVTGYVVAIVALRAGRVKDRFTISNLLGTCWYAP